VFEMERLRCNACCQVFTAEEPAGVGAGPWALGKSRPVELG
jgi:hypothetical protein